MPLNTERATSLSPSSYTSLVLLPEWKTKSAIRRLLLTVIYLTKNNENILTNYILYGFNTKQRQQKLIPNYLCPCLDARFTE